MPQIHNSLTYIVITVIGHLGHIAHFPTDRYRFWVVEVFRNYC